MSNKVAKISKFSRCTKCRIFQNDDHNLYFWFAELRSRISSLFLLLLKPVCIGLLRKALLMPLGPSVLTLKNLNIGTTNLMKANSMVNVISVFGRSRFYQSQETKILVHSQISEPAKIKIKQ